MAILLPLVGIGALTVLYVWQLWRTRLPPGTKRLPGPSGHLSLSLLFSDSFISHKMTANKLPQAGQ
jgi:hypothetical protein